VARIRFDADGSLDPMTLTRTTTLAAAVLALAFLAGPSVAADLKVAYVDMEKAFSTCSAGMTAKTKFTRKLEDLTRRIESREGELTRLRSELEKSAGSMGDS
jgi:outer membrane protein